MLALAMGIPEGIWEGQRNQQTCKVCQTAWVLPGRISGFMCRYLWACPDLHSPTEEMSPYCSSPGCPRCTTSIPLLLMVVALFNTADDAGETGHKADGTSRRTRHSTPFLVTRLHFSLGKTSKHRQGWHKNLHLGQRAQAIFKHVKCSGGGVTMMMQMMIRNQACRGLHG